MANTSGTSGSDADMMGLFAEKGAPSAATRIVATVSAQGAVTAAEISEITGLARSTVSTALSELKDAGLIVESEPGKSAAPRIVGRPVKQISLNPQAGTAVGIHLGLAEVEIALLDTSHTIVARERVPLGMDYAPKDAAATARDALGALFRRHDRSLNRLIGIGVSVSGPVSPDGRVLRSSILPKWAGQNVAQLFGPHFDRPVRVENEANCSAIAEMMWGAARGHREFLMLKIGLGVGGAVVRNGQVMTGIAGGGGEFGHICLDPGGALCRCGNRGCLETLAGFAAPLAEVNARRAAALDISEAVALAQAGDAELRALIQRSGAAAGWGLAVLCSAANPPLVLISGLLAQAGDLLMGPLMETFERHVMIKPAEVPPEHRTQIALGRFLTDDSLRGAAGLVLHSIDSVLRQQAD